MDEGGSLENCWAGFPVPWVQIPPSPRPTHPASDRHQAGGSLLAPGAWSLNRRGGRVDEGGSLENCWARLGLVGSNPTPSAACADRVSPPTRRRNPSRPRQTNPSPVAARRACCEGARSRCSAARWTGSNPTPSAKRTEREVVCLPPKGGVPHGAAVRGGGKVSTTQASRRVWVSTSVSVPSGHRSTSPCGGGHTSPLTPRYSFLYNTARREVWSALQLEPPDVC